MKIKRVYTLAELEKINNHMMNYTIDLKVYGCIETIMHVRIGLTGNHSEIIQKLVKDEWGNQAEILRARITGKQWSSGNLADCFME